MQCSYLWSRPGKIEQELHRHQTAGVAGCCNIFFCSLPSTSASCDAAVHVGLISWGVLPVSWYVSPRDLTCEPSFYSQKSCKNAKAKKKKISRGRDETDIQYMMIASQWDHPGEKKFITPKPKSADGPMPLWVRGLTRIIDNPPEKSSVWFGSSHCNKLLHMRAQRVQGCARVPDWGISNPAIVFIQEEEI